MHSNFLYYFVLICLRIDDTVKVGNKFKLQNYFYEIFDRIDLKSVYRIYSNMNIEHGQGFRPIFLET